ncbi:MAG TPA: ABC transporter permease, partial [Candidatus Solibacter sp.]|nr:ABC transporter permease [Candidatus Solibacter sp.]
MSWARVIAARIRGLFGRQGQERELDDEVQFHLELQIDDNIRAGMNPADARYAALRSFGGIDLAKERYRDQRSIVFIETTAQDMRYALRMMRKSPGFTITAVSVLALAIGANTTMFSVLDTVLLRPLPYPEPDRLAMLWTENPAQNIREGRSAYWNVEQWRSQSRSFADIAVFDGVSATLIWADRAEQISIVRHSANLLRMLGVQPVLGRLFSADEAEQRQRVALISHRLWQSHFSGSREVLGTTINVDGVPKQVIGVLPADLRFFGNNSDVWEPHTMFADWENIRRARGSGFWSVIGRLRPKVTLEQAQAEMDAIAQRLDPQLPIAEQRRGISVAAMTLTGHRARLMFWMLTGAVFCVLLIAATNVASLSLARNATRKRELAVRVALGASRARIVRQLLAESVALVGTSCLLAVGVAYTGIQLIRWLMPDTVARMNEINLDPRVLAAMFVFCIPVCLLVGLVPGITLTRRDFREAEGGRGIAGGLSTHRLRRVLVAAQFALAIVLLAGAGLLVRSLWSAEDVDLGFRPERVLVVALATPAEMAVTHRAGFYARTLENVASVPGVESAAIASELFIGGNVERSVTVEGDTGGASQRLRLRSDEVSADFFKALGAPLLKGRWFSTADGLALPRVAIINETMARRLWPDRDPVGKRFLLSASDSGALWFTVVGVAGDMRRQGIEIEPIPQMFEPLAQNPPRRAVLVVRTSTAEPMPMASSVQAAVRRVEKYAPVYGVTTLESRLGDFLTERRFQTSMLLAFAGVALLMAAIGIYGLIQYSVAARTREIGIRM